MKKLFYPTLFCAIFLSFSSGLQAQCTEWLNPTPTTGWTNFNTSFGGAPCDDGEGCPFNEIDDFEVYAAEAYTVTGFQEGGTYAFSICNGPGAGSWVPEFTIIAASGAVDAFGAGDGDGCTITWTASESGTYYIVINEEGQCGGGPNTGVDNGYPALTCVSGPEVACPVGGCGVGELTTNDSTIVCSPEGTFIVSTDGNDTIPKLGGFGWAFDDVLGGTGGLAGGFTLTSASPTDTFNRDLNGVLSENDLDSLGGVWVVRAVVYGNEDDPINTICSVSSDSLIVRFGESPSLSFEDLGDGSVTVTATGGSEPYTYEWSDGQTTATATGLDPGAYTVTVTDALGCSTVETVDVMVAVGEISGLHSLYLGPNPSTGELTVDLRMAEPGDIRIEIRGITGQTMQLVDRSNTAHLRQQLDLSRLPNGLYFVRIAVGEDELSKKIILNR